MCQAAECLVQVSNNDSVSLVNHYDSGGVSLVGSHLLVGLDINVYKIESIREFVAPLWDQQTRDQHKNPQMRGIQV